MNTAIDNTTLDQYRRMFHAACSALGEISDDLGVDPEDGGAEPILEAIAELRAKANRHGELLEFVKFVVREWGHDGFGIELEEGDSSVIDRARLLIAKSEGNGAPAYSDSTQFLHVGDSAFENWYSGYATAGKSDKQRARDAYAAGMGDLLVVAAPAAVAGPVKFTAAHVSYIDRYGGRCRDCADEGGVCPNRGLPCADSTKAIRFVLDALAYGINHGYINVPRTTQPAQVAQGDALPREDFAWMVVQEACETEPADEDDPECIRILRRDLKSAVLAAFLREDDARSQAKEGGAA